MIPLKGLMISPRRASRFVQGRLFVHCFLVELGFGNIGYCGVRKTGEPRQNLRNRDETRLRLHWWEAGVFTTMPSLLPA